MVTDISSLAKGVVRVYRRIFFWWGAGVGFFYFARQIRSKGTSREWKGMFKI